MPSADAEATEETVADDVPEEPVDEARTALLEALTDELGEVLVASHLEPGKDLWIRVPNESWSELADYLRNRQRFRFFDWLSAIDWMPSPFGRSLDAEVDKELANPAERAAEEAKAEDATLTGTGADGVTGGDTRFQVIARVYNLTTNLGLNVKADVGADLSIGSWTHEYPGADWHEREAWEMYGITFTGHPGLRNLYLPGDFEGHPLRKDFPLLARLVKPWPGIVDVEPMPEPPSEPESSGAAGPPLASEASDGIVDVEPMPEPELPDGGSEPELSDGGSEPELPDGGPEGSGAQ